MPDPWGASPLPPPGARDQLAGRHRPASPQPRDPGDAAWLRALVWADHPERAVLLDGALRAAASRPPVPVHAGDAAERLPALVATAPVTAAVAIFHTAFLAHLPALERERFEHLVVVLSTARPIYWIQAEPRHDPPSPACA